MDTVEERDQAIFHVEKAMGVWAGVNEAVQLRKASSKWHQEPTPSTVPSPACSCHTHSFLRAAG